MSKTNYIWFRDYALTPIRSSTKRGGIMANAYERSDTCSIYEQYVRPSAYKIAAFDRCRKMCADLDGRGLRITGGNCMQFSAAFRCVIDGQEVIIYLTKDNNYVII